MRLELALVRGEVGAKVGRGVRLGVLGVPLVVGVEEVHGEEVHGEEAHGEGEGEDDRRMGRALGTVAGLGDHDLARGAKFHAPTTRSLDDPRMDGEARRQEERRRRLGWDRKYP